MTEIRTMHALRSPSYAEANNKESRLGLFARACEITCQRNTPEPILKPSSHAHLHSQPAAMFDGVSSGPKAGHGRAVSAAR